MKIALSPLEFARRARRLYADREAVVDGDGRWTYAQFFDRCDRWSSALQAMGIGSGDRVAYIAPNTHAQLEGYYAVPQIGAVLVPVNYRLTPDDFVYLLNHSGARAVCAHSDYLDALDGVRDRLTSVEKFVAMEGGADRSGWLDYESILAQSSPSFARPEISEDSLLTINYTSGTTAKPKGVMMTHRNAYMNTVGTMVHVHMTCAERYLWTLPMFHANGWTFVWTITAAGGTHLCLRRVDPVRVFDLIRKERATMLCAAPTVLIAIANSAEEHRRNLPRGLRVLTAGAPPAAATIGRLEREFGGELTQVYG
jgi:fatty-acyl-CoA synthase